MKEEKEFHRERVLWVEVVVCQSEGGKGNGSAETDWAGLQGFCMLRAGANTDQIRSSER